MAKILYKVSGVLQDLCIPLGDFLSDTSGYTSRPNEKNSTNWCVRQPLKLLHRDIGSLLFAFVVHIWLRYFRLERIDVKVGKRIKMPFVSVLVR